MSTVIISHPTGNANVRAAVKGLAETQLLYKFYTALAFFPNSIFYRFSNFGALTEIRRREFDPLLAAYTQIYPWREIGRLLSLKLNLNKFIQPEKGLFCIDNVYQKLDQQIAAQLKKIADKGINGVYAYEDGAHFTFREAKKNGMKCLYDLPTVHWRYAKKIREAESQLLPEWAGTIVGLSDSDEKLERKDQELKLSDHIFVASSITAESLKEFPGNLAPIEVIPYGFPPVNETRDFRLSPSKNPLKLLFVGRLTQLKGISYLFKAVENLRDRVSLTVVGSKPVDDCKLLNKALTKYRWIPSLAHNEILDLMKIHDVLVFPSLFEGFGLVITEAMSQGTPVITTNRTAGFDLINHGVNGWIVDPGSTESLQAAIENLLENPQLIAEAGKMAIETAKKRPWLVYGKEISNSVKELINPR